MNCIRRALVALSVCLFCLVAPGADAAELTVNKIAAVVNGEMVTLHELRMHTAAELARQRIPQNDARAEAMQKEVLNSMINDILMRQEAKRYQITVSDAEVDQEMQGFIRRSGISQEQFEAELKKQGGSMQMYKDRIRDNLLKQRIGNFMIARKVFVTPEEVSAYYHSNQDKFKGERRVDFSMIMLPEKLNVQQIYQEIKSGKLKFEDAAKQYSADRSAKEGGRIDGVPWDKMPPEMQKLLASLKDGAISSLFKTKGGFVLFKRHAVHEARPLTFEEARPQVEDMLRAPMLEERFKEYIGQLRGKAVIDIRI